MGTGEEMIKIVYNKGVYHNVRVYIGDVRLGASDVSGGSYVYRRDALHRIKQIKEACDNAKLPWTYEER
jgi:hypothetical protein